MVVTGEDMEHTIDATRTVGELATDIPGAARIFQETGIDFCCGGKRSLRAVCDAQGLEVHELLAALEAELSSPEPAPDVHWKTGPVAALIAHIVEKHHGYIRAETPRIEVWMEKVVQVHGDRHPELLRIRHAFAGMASEMMRHMTKEEQILFPCIANLETPPPAGAPAPAASFATISMPVQMMMQEHDHTGRDLAEIRQHAGDYAPPPDACATYRALYQALAAFEADMRRHVHLENNILFPRAIALEGYAG